MNPRFWLVWAAVFFIIAVRPAYAGPPFRTDDPEPVDYQHWEFYAATQYTNDRGDVSGTAPHFEVNYGALPNAQLHLLVPNAYDRPKDGPWSFGPGNIEFGVKYRFLQEADWVPIAGVFPLIEVPTASKARGLGTGQVQFFLPLWLQKSVGPWTTYGGGGYWINPGAGNKDYWYAGWLLQRDITKLATIGVELFRTTPPAVGAGSQAGYNVGALLNLSEKHHVIGSAGSDIHGPANFFFYLAYLMTWGPKETGETRKGGPVDWRGFAHLP